MSTRLMKGQYSRAEAEAELDRMEQEFGERAFTTGKVTRKSKPWSMEDLKDLERDFMGQRQLPQIL